MTLKLVVFDVDGTLVDSQAHIVGSMAAAFEGVGLTPPDRAAILGIVGLSLPVAMARLAPDAGEKTQAALVEGYKRGYSELRAQAGSAASSPLYPGALEALQALHAVPDVLLGVATGKSRRGLDILLEDQGLRRFFVTYHCADDHPSKPHPSMLMSCLAETGVAPEDAIMVGDTSFDMDMARAAGMRGVGVTWGYHAADRIGADRVVTEFAQVPGAAFEMLGVSP